MKFSLAIVASIASVVAAGNLRATSTSDEAVTVQSRVTMSGLLHLPTMDELAVLDKIVKETYNHGYSQADISMLETTSTGAVSLEGDDATMIISEFVAQGGGYCQFCGPDDYDDWDCYIDPNCGKLETLTLAQVVNKQASMMHGRFQKHMCKQLRASGVANFANVKKCSFNVLENPGSFVTRLSEENAYEAMNGRVTDVELSMLGLTKDLSKADLKFLEDAVVEAHNDAFDQTGYKLKDFATVSFMDTDDAMNGAGLFLGHATPTASDEDKSEKTFDLAEIHQAFEVAFCSKLQNSGLAAFSAVNECLFRFVYNPIAEAKAAVVATSA